MKAAWSRSWIPVAAIGIVILASTGQQSGAQDGAGDYGAVSDETAQSNQRQPPHIVDLPGLGPTDLGEFPPDVRANIRIPGVEYKEPEEEYGDLPPLANPPKSDIPGPAANAAVQSVEILPASAVPTPTPDKLREQWAKEMREERMKRLREERARMPEDAYIKAQEQQQRLEAGETSPTTPPGPQSGLRGLGRWAESVWARWWTRTAVAQAGQCIDAPTWQQIGPAPYRLSKPRATGLVRNAGIIKSIVVDKTSPQNSRTLYIGTRDAGLWKSTDGGDSWSPKTDNLPAPNKTSLHVEAIVIDPNNASRILGGTGLAGKSGSLFEIDGTALDKSIGMLRSSDWGDHWAQVGPAWCAQSDNACWDGTTCWRADPMQCASTIPTNSTLKIKEITIDDNRVWAATSKGLWYSDNALTNTPNEVTWTLVSPPGTCTSGCLPKANSSTPESINHIFVKATDHNVLYASAGASAVQNNGWYRSAQRGANGSWVKVNGPSCSQPGINGCLPTNPEIQRAAFFPGAAGANDTIYAIVPGPAEDCNSSNNVERLYKTIDSGQTWARLQPAGWDCGGLQSVTVDPRRAAHIVFGGFRLWRSMDGGATATPIGDDLIHVDQNAQAFDPSSTGSDQYGVFSNLLYVGSDGGISWRASLSAQQTLEPTWTNLQENNLANLEFQSNFEAGTGAVDLLNYGVSAGGLQDNGQLRSGAPLLWTATIPDTDGFHQIIDPLDSNVAYFDLGAGILKTSDGYRDFPAVRSGIPDDVALNPIAIFPSDNRKLLTMSHPNPDPNKSQDHRIYLTTTAAEPDGPNPAWVPISNPPPAGPSDVFSFAVTPLGTIVYGGTSAGLWRTTNLTDPASWARVDDDPDPARQLPNRPIASLVIDTSKACDPGVDLCSAQCGCTMYASVAGRNAEGGHSGHIFRSTDSGQTWDDIGSVLPDVPFTKTVIDPGCPNVIYVGTEMGIYQGTFAPSSGGPCCPTDSSTCTGDTGTWTWCTFMTGFPKTAVVEDLIVHPDSGLLRAFTYGRSVWETQAFQIPNPDQIVNTVNPVTEVHGARIGSDSSGQKYSVVWADDCTGANRWHVFLRAFQYDGNGNPTWIASDVQVDDMSPPAVQLPSFAADTTAGNGGWVAWSDDRLDQVNHVNHVFYQYIRSDSGGNTKLYVSDMQADTQAANLNACIPPWLFNRTCMACSLPRPGRPIRERTLRTRCMRASSVPSGLRRHHPR